MSAPDQAAPISTDDLRKLVDAVTPGKWRKHGNGQQIFGGKEGQIIATMIYGGVSKANSRLIALAPQLAAEVLARRADLAAPSAPAEVEGLVPPELYSACQRCVENRNHEEAGCRLEDLRHDGEMWSCEECWTTEESGKWADAPKPATALTALQARAEKAEAELDAWKTNAEALAKSIRGCGVVSMWATAIPNALASHAKLKGEA